MKKVFIIGAFMPMVALAQMGIGEFEQRQIEQTRPLEMEQLEPHFTSNPSTSFFYAVLNHNYVKLEDLIQQGTNPNVRDDHGNTPLHYARTVKMIDFLVANGADINAQNEEGITPLHVNVIMGHINIVNDLIKKGADVNLATNQGVTPLHLATAISYLYFADPILKGVAYTVVGGEVVAVINISVILGELMAELGLITGVGAATSASLGGAAVVSAIAAIDIGIRNKIVSDLLNAGANVNAQDKEGNTPLHTLAAGRLLKPSNRRGGIIMAEHLIKRGAQLNIKNNNGQIPYDVALEYKRYPLSIVLFPDKVKTLKQKVKEAQEAVMRAGSVAKEVAVEKVKKVGELAEGYVIKPSKELARETKKKLRKQEKKLLKKRLEQIEQAEQEETAY